LIARRSHLNQQAAFDQSVHHRAAGSDWQMLRRNRQQLRVLEVTDRVFVVGVHMTREPTLDARSWADRARNIGYDLAKRFGATDCVIILKARRSRFFTFHGISFFSVPSKRFPRVGPFGRLSYIVFGQSMLNQSGTITIWSSRVD
jgi:hypothetical protein